jgi:DNA-binding transcriptional ArsR family regulator
VRVNTEIVFRALADPSRRALFERLTRGESTVKDLTSQFEISQPAVSQHLGILRSAGLVTERHEGRRVYYKVHPEGLKPLVDWLAHYKVINILHFRRMETSGIQ